MAEGGDTIAIAPDTLKELISEAIGNYINNEGNINTNIANSVILVPVLIGSRWKRAITFLASGTRTTSGSGDYVDVSDVFSLSICVNVTAVSGTSPSLTVKIIALDEISGSERVIGEIDDITDVGSYFVDISPVNYRKVKVYYDISGTLPSFTFSVTAQGST